jgi:thiamine-monophosphate kinase
VARPGEFELIERFVRGFPRGEGVRVGIGDDAAVLRPSRGEDLVATVDAVVEGVHFTRALPRRRWAGSRAP